MIYNEAQFNQMYQEAIKNAVDYVTEKVLEKYGQYIERYVYKGYKPVVYERTGDFKSSLTSEELTERLGGASRIYQDTEKMEYNPQEYQHGSPISGDVRDSLAKILYEGLHQVYFVGLLLVVIAFALTFVVREKSDRIREY